MLIAFWCIAVAWLMSFPPSWIAVLWLQRHGGYDNHTPRRRALELDGWGLRAKSAHYNCLESLPAFAAGVFVAHLGGGDPARLTQLSVAFIAVRVVYVAFYLANQATLRSSAWTVGLLLNAGLFVLPVLK